MADETPKRDPETLRALADGDDGLVWLLSAGVRPALVGSIRENVRTHAHAWAADKARLEAAERRNERVMRMAAAKVKGRHSGEALDFVCKHCAKKTPLVVDALLAALAAQDANDRKSAERRD